MAQMTLPSAPSYRRTSYSGLLGCDFSVDPALVSRKRSPDCLNMISDNGGNPVKRKGWEVVDLEGLPTHSDGCAVENIWMFRANGNLFIVFTAKNYPNDSSTLYCLRKTGNSIELEDIGTVVVPTGKLGAFYTDISDEQFGLYILGVSEYHRIYYDESDDQAKHELVQPYVPTITISRKPSGGGEAYEEVNLLTRERAEMFLNESGNKVFRLSFQPVADSVRVWYLGGDNGDTWIEEPSGNISVNTTTWKVTLTTAHEPVVAGEDNIKIQYTASGSSLAPRIFRNTETAHFSRMIYDQIFLTGNTKKRNTVFYSKVNDITYFPDTYYLKMNGESNAKGFLNVGEYLAVVKEGSANDNTVFLIYPTTYNSTETTAVADGNGNITLETKQKADWTFALKRSIAGVGAVANRAFAVLGDEPLFLSTNGVYGIASIDTTSDKIVRNRSFLLDQKLTREPNLENAVATEWNNYYVLVANGHAYILDGRHKTNNYAGNTSYGYEAYYWDNIPAVSIASCEDELWFGTEDGCVCRFKSDDDSKAFSDGTSREDSTVDGEAIIARWSTPLDNDDMSEYFKTMQKKGTMCTVAPYTRSSVKVYINVDGYGRQYIGEMYVDRADLFDGVIDFERLSFDTSTAPRDYFFRKKRKKYKRLQIILENDALNEPFGVFEIVKTYIYQRFAK